MKIAFMHDKLSSQYTLLVQNISVGHHIIQRNEDVLESMADRGGGKEVRWLGGCTKHRPQVMKSEWDMSYSNLKVIWRDCNQMLSFIGFVCYGIFTKAYKIN